MVSLVIYHSSSLLHTIIKKFLPVCWNSSWAHHSTITARGKSKMKKKKDRLCNKKKYLKLDFNQGSSLLHSLHSPLVILIKPIENSQWSCQFSVKIKKKVNVGATEGQHWFRRHFPSSKLKAVINPTGKKQTNKPKKKKTNKTKQKSMSLTKTQGLGWPKEVREVYTDHKHPVRVRSMA